jgi:hypothetical protein
MRSRRPRGLRRIDPTLYRAIGCLVEGSNAPSESPMLHRKNPMACRKVRCPVGRIQGSVGKSDAPLEESNASSESPTVRRKVRRSIGRIQGSVGKSDAPLGESNVTLEGSNAEWAEALQVFGLDLGQGMLGQIAARHGPQAAGVREPTSRHRDDALDRRPPALRQPAPSIPDRPPPRLLSGPRRHGCERDQEDQGGAAQSSTLGVVGVVFDFQSPLE